MTTARRFPRPALASDLGAGLNVALVSIPEGMAYALVAGVNPVYGLYTGMVTTIVAALTGTTSRLIVTLTNALALVAGEQLAALNPEDPARALFTLTFLVGICMSVLGLLRMGSVIRFVSKEVMTGFIFATALLIVLGQYKDLVGYESEAEGSKLVKAIDITRHMSSWDGGTVLAGLVSIAILVALKLSPLRRYGDVLIIVFATLLVALLGSEGIALVGDIAAVPSGIGALPMPVLPDFGMIPLLLGGAVAATVVGLSESSGVGAAYPNADGSRSNMSRDFLGQGLGNIAGSFFQALPACGSLSRTAINVSGGAQTRMSGVFSGLLMALVLVLFGSAAELIPLTGLAALLIVIGFEVMLRTGRELALAWRTSRANTFLAALVIAIGILEDLTMAIFAGVLLSLLAFAVRAATDVRVVELRPDDDGDWSERPVPSRFDPGSTAVLEVRGNLYFATVYSFDEILPEAGSLDGVTLILRVRDRQLQSLTGLSWLEGYAERVKAAGGRLALADVDKATLDVLRRTGAAEVIGPDNLFEAGDRIFGGTRAALASVRREASAGD